MELALTKPLQNRLREYPMEEGEPFALSSPASNRQPSMPPFSGALKVRRLGPCASREMTTSDKASDPWRSGNPWAFISVSADFFTTKKRCVEDRRLTSSVGHGSNRCTPEISTLANNSFAKLLRGAPPR
jgi:hypothetical protein